MPASGKSIECWVQDVRSRPQPAIFLRVTKVGFGHRLSRRTKASCGSSWKTLSTLTGPCGHCRAAIPLTGSAGGVILTVR